MFAEKWKLLDALKESIPDANIVESTEYAIEKGGKYPTIAVDFGVWQMQGTSEDGAVYDTLPQYAISVFVRPTPGNIRLQEEEANKYHGAITYAITQAFAGTQFTIFGQPAGTGPFGNAEAFGVSYTVDLGPMDAKFSS